MSIHFGDRRIADDSNRPLKLTKSLRALYELLKDKEDCKSAPELFALPPARVAKKESQQTRRTLRPEELTFHHAGR
jgi:hypothetical protein